MHNLLLAYFVNLYMFRAYLGPSSGGTTVCIQQQVLILFRWLSVVLVGLEQTKIIININYCIRTVVPPDDGPRYARNMYRMTKYTKNKLCIKLVFFTRLSFNFLRTDHVSMSNSQIFYTFKTPDGNFIFFLHLFKKKLVMAINCDMRGRRRM